MFIPYRIRVFLCLLLFLFSLSPAVVRAKDKGIDKAAKLMDEAHQLIKKGHFREAIPLIEKEVKVKSVTHGENHPSVAMSYNILGKSYKSLNDPAAAKSNFSKSIRIVQNSLGPNHLIAMELHKELASVSMMLGAYTESESHLKKVLAVYKKQYGENSLRLATIHNNLGEVYRYLGEYKKAEAEYKKTLFIHESNSGVKDIHKAAVLNNLGLLNYHLQDWDRSEAYYLRAFELLQLANVKEDDSRVATIMNNLGVIFHKKGRYEKAELMFHKALLSRKKNFGTFSEPVAESMSNLAQLYEDLGEPNKSLGIMKTNLGVYDRLYGRNHPKYAKALGNLGRTHCRMGEYKKALECFKSALSVSNEKLGPEHPESIVLLNNLSALFSRLGLFDAAESSQKKVLSLYKKQFGKNSLHTADAQNNLAVLYTIRGRYTEAESLLLTSLNIREKILGNLHPTIAESLVNLAVLSASKMNYDKSLFEIRKAIEIHSRTIDSVLTFTSERRKLSYIKKMEHSLHFYISLVAQKFEGNIPVEKDAFEIWMNRKGIVLESLIQSLDQVHSKDSTKGGRLIQELQSVRHEISNLCLKMPDKDGYSGYSERFSQLVTRKEILEDQLRGLGTVPGQLNISEKANISRVVDVLNHKSVIIDIAKVNMYNFRKSQFDREWNPSHYIAFFVSSDHEKPIIIVDLGNSAKVDAKIFDLRNELENIGVQNEKSYKKSLQALHKILFEPLEKYIETGQYVYVVPDWQLNLIPFEILQDSKGVYLADKYTFNYLNRSKDLIYFGKNKKNHNSFVLIGNPDFDYAFTDTKNLEKKGGDGKLEGVGKLSKQSEPKRIEFSPLPQTKNEILAIKQILKNKNVEIYLGKEASPLCQDSCRMN